MNSHKIEKYLFIYLRKFIFFIMAADLNVATTSGVSNGYIKNNVIVWEDIPFAQPPVGDLRWKAPRKY